MNEYVFTAEDIKTMVADALEGKADWYDHENVEEDRKGAANRSKINTYIFTAQTLRDIAEVIRGLPDSEMREIIPEEPVVTYTVEEARLADTVVTPPSGPFIAVDNMEGSISETTSPYAAEQAPAKAPVVPELDGQAPEEVRGTLDLQFLLNMPPADLAKLARQFKLKLADYDSHEALAKAVSEQEVTAAD